MKRPAALATATILAAFGVAGTGAAAANAATTAAAAKAAAEEFHDAQRAVGVLAGQQDPASAAEEPEGF